MTKFKEYIKIDGADSIISSISKTSTEFDDAISKTHIIKENRKAKYHEITRAKELSLALLEDIERLNSLFAKKEPVEKPIKRGRIKKRGRPRKTKAQKVKSMKKSLKALKKGLRKK
jgi:hypothetical protein